MGLLQIVGSLAGSRFLVALGTLSGASPLPRVFGRQQGIETFGRRASVELHTADGEVHWIPVDRGFGRQVEGPMIRVAAYAHAALFAGLPGSDPRYALLRRAFCPPGAVARELGVEAPVRWLRVQGASVLPNDEPASGVEIHCP